MRGGAGGVTGTVGALEAGVVAKPAAVGCWSRAVIAGMIGATRSAQCAPGEAHAGLRAARGRFRWGTMSRDRQQQPLDPWAGVSVEVVHADLYPCPPSWRIKAHVVDRHGLFFAWKGHGWIERDGERYALAPGDLSYFRSGQRYAAGHDPDRPLTVLSIGMRLTGPAGSDPLRALALPDRVSLPPNEAHRVIAGFNDVIAEHQRRAPAAALAAQGSALRLLALALRLAAELPAAQRHGVQPAQPGERTRLAAVLAHIDAHLDERLSLPTLARIARLSPAYFAAYFRERTGTTAMEHLRRRRIEAARALLRESDAPIEDIARRVGFPDPFHFSRLFRKLVGKSPSSYRSSPADPWAP